MKANQELIAADDMAFVEEQIPEVLEAYLPEKLSEKALSKLPSVKSGKSAKSSKKS